MINLDSDKLELWRDVQQRATRLRSTFQERDRIVEELRKMVHMEWTEKPTASWVKDTMSPSAYNSFMGAVRLMVSTSPQFNVPYPEANMAMKSVSEKIERAATVIWNGSSRVTGRPTHQEAVMSSLLAGEVFGYVSRTKDIVESMKGMKRKGYLRQAKQAASRTPYLFKINNPASCYPEYNALGLYSVLRRAEVTWGEAVSIYGAPAEDQAANVEMDAKITLNEWVDYDARIVWVEGQSDPLYIAELDTDFLPVVSGITEGSLIFDLPEQQRLPFLYSLYKSSMWKRENLLLTVIFSMIHGVGSLPLLVAETDDPDSEIVIDRNEPGGIVRMRRGDSLKILAEKVVDPSQWQGLQTAQSYSEASTIPSVALGAPPAGNLAFATVSTLIQAGRLPLIGTKEGVADIAAEMVVRALTWWKDDAGNLYDKDGQPIMLDPNEIPDRLPLKCMLDVDLPTDKLQLANAAIGLKNSGMMPRRWIREGVLGAGQSGAIDDEMHREALQDNIVAMYMEKMQQTQRDELEFQKILKMEQIKAQMQSMATAGAPEGAPGPVPGGVPA